MKKKYKSSYASENDVPKDVRHLYHYEDGEWKFNGAMVDGLAEALNPGLAANKQELLDEKKEAKEALEEEKRRADDAEKELRKYKVDGSKILSKTEAEQFEKYRALGAPDDISKKLDEHAAQGEKLGRIETEGELRKFCEENKLNFEAVKDLMSSEKAKGGKLSVKKMKLDGAKDETDVPHIAIDTDVDGKIKTEELPLSKFVVEKGVPGYLAKAIFETETSNANGKKEASSGTRFPPLSQGKSNDGGDNAGTNAETVVKSFNGKRDTRVLPWQQKETAKT